MYFLYSLLLAFAFVCGAPYWLFQMLRHGKYRHGLSERLGVVPQRLTRDHKPSIWVHAVSVGEVLAVSELVRRIKSDFPNHRIVVSTTTDTGQKLAAARFGMENVFYFPFDFKFCVSPYLKTLRPVLIVIAETEFWPNLLRAVQQHGTQAAVVNARISDRSLAGYRRWRFLLTRVLNNVDLFLAQTPEDARRLAEVGAPPERTFVGGNLKFDVPALRATPIVLQLRTALKSSGSGPVLVCGSTVEGEEPMLLDAFNAVLSTHPHAVMLLAPRHPERFSQVAELIQRSQFNFMKRSAWNDEPLSGGVLLIDTIGELAGLYALADLAFVGGSLVPRGGHSILEPAQHGVAILVGPHTENFRDIVELFRNRDALRIIDQASVKDAFMELLARENERRALGQRALEVFHSQQGATDFTLEKLRTLLKLATREAHTV